MEKIYISGRISGLPIEEVAAKFDETETKLKAQGYEVINPLRLLVIIVNFCRSYR